VESYSDIGKKYEFIKGLVRSGVDTKFGLSQLLDYCETNWPHDVWGRIRQIDIESDLAHLRHWIWHLLATQPPPNSTEALFFGLSNPILESGAVSCDLHMTGSDHFDADDEEWVCYTNYIPRDQNFADLVSCIRFIRLSRRLK
jgi:hypothetical protein